MASVASFPAQPLTPMSLDGPTDRKILDVSNNTSGSSTASSILIRSTNLPPHSKPSPSDRSSGRRASSSSFSSTGSQRIRIKAKYLREVKSPFEDEEGSNKPNENYVPPALPRNLPPGYEKKRETADAVIQGDRRKSLGYQSDQNAPPETNADRSSISKRDDSHENAKSNGVKSSLLKKGDRVKSNSKPSATSLLKQGAPTSSHQLHSQPSDLNNDVRITQFAAGGKQKVLQEQLLKRQESSGPVKRYVRPTLVGSDHGLTQPDRQNPLRKGAEDISNPNTVAAVTAAAVAATVPIVKAQTDLESKMDAMMAKLANLHEMTDRAQQPQGERQQQQPAIVATQLSDKASELQRQLDDAVSKRLQQLEKLQDRQLEWQERFMMANQHLPQRQEKHPSPTQSGSYSGKSPTSINGVRSGISEQLIPQRDVMRTANLPAEMVPGQPAGPENQKTQSQKFHSAFSQHAVVEPQEMLTSRGGRIQRVDSHQSIEFQSQKQSRYTPAVTLHRHLPHNDAQPKPRPEIVSSDNNAEIGLGKRVGTASPLDTPAPRRHAPQPLTQNPPPKMTRAGRGLLEEILTSHDEEERRVTTRGRQMHTPQATAIREVTSPESAAELKAASLVQQLSKLKKEMKEMKTDLIQNIHSEGRDSKMKQDHVHSPVKRRHSELREEAEKDWDELMQRRLQPAPVDIYLRKPTSVPVSVHPAPHPKQPLSPSQYNAPVAPSLCTNAKAVLDKVQSSRACLEANLEAVVRAKEQEEFYSYLDSLHLQGDAAEKAQLRYRVGRMIAALDGEFKHEINKQRRPHPSDHIPEKDATGTGPGQGPVASSARPVRAGAKKKPVSARIDSGLRKGHPPPPPSGGEAGAGGRHNKENVAQAKKQPISRSKKQSPVDHNQDEAYLTRVYGKALYQARRSTMQKEPYLKLATSSPWPKPARVPSPTRVKGTGMKSAKIQTDSSSRTINIPRPANQFFFDPYPITPSSVPFQTEPSRVHPAFSTCQPAPLSAPSHGQLIPMAVPLAPPQVGGLAQPVTIKTDGLEVGVIKNLEKREVKNNVAVVNIQSKEKRPKLAIQHLPAVDIDTELSSQASIASEPDGSPKVETLQDRQAEIPPVEDDTLPGQSQFSHYLAVAEDDEPQEESEDELPTPGISLPGRYTEMERPYHGPPFPPQAPPPDPSMVGPSSEKLASDIRRDIMENAAMEWIEQELMAQMISELYSRRAVEDPRPISPDTSVTSSASDSIVETIGPAGLQLFVDAGQAVDHTLVSALVREVLEEKVTTALGQHDRDVPRRQLMPATPVAPDTDSRTPIPTPEVTPQVSPVHTPPLVASRVATPLASPSEASLVESETESLKEVVLTQNTPAGDEPIPAPSTYVTTPIHTPPPSPPPDIPTPEGSPRESPKLISVVDGSVITPVRTPEPASPEPEVEESVALPPSPEPEIVQEEPPPPTPSPSLPTPSTPTPTPSSDTTTQPTPSTETAGQTISEGEWLISVKSEGQIEESTEDEPGVVAVRQVSISSSIDSTLMGTEDLEKDMQEYELSEGEISPTKPTPKLHSQDPVVALLAHMRRRPDPSAAPAGILPYHTPSQTLNNDTRSLGEVSVGQRPALTPSSERQLFEEAYGAKPPQVTPPSEVTGRRSPGEVGSKDQLGTVRPAVEDSTLRISQLDGTKHKEPLQGRKLTPAEQKKTETAPSPAPRIIQVVGKSSSPEPAQRDKTKDLGGVGPRHDSDELSEGDIDDDHDGDFTQAKDGEKITSRAPIPPNLFGTQTMSDLGTRTLTPDALNLEALLQSGYLSQTFSQSEGGTSDFESFKPPGLASTHATVSSSGTPLQAAGHQPLTEDFLDVLDEEKDADKAAGAMSFSVTLPSAAESQGLDFSQTISEGEIPPADTGTTSDVSELSGGTLP
ncbi:TALPID3 protein-like isoform X2 [Acanthaster planci]|nr:TALPID3 protein-like isoform X2 [Acanthaster planci]XP_022081341.1 TALPID3 protein-like isoform X2 [Acanthaster planci]XP_022081342.1 TALPID3 protein-like isoform X2 [Acanthaster planci]